jgi:hypothetical protein
VAQIDAILYKNYGVRLENVDIHTYCRLYAEWQYLTRVNYENQKAALLDAASEILKAIFPSN